MKPKSHRVALVLDLEWPYKRHVGTFSGMQQYAEEQGWEATIDAYLFDALPSGPTKPVPFDGIIALATKQLAERAARLRLPLVNVWFQSPMRNALPGVFPDYSAAGRLRAEHLLARGLRDFATVVTRNFRADILEEKAFRRTLHEAGCSCASVRIGEYPWRTRAQWQKNKQTLAEEMDRWRLPVGVFVGAENVGRIVAQMCRERGWRVPEDVAIIAGYNEDAICEYPRPTLTSVELGHERIGYEAARLLDRLMADRALPTERILLPPISLVVRDSTDFFAVDDDLVAAALEFIAANSHRPIKADDVARAVATGTRALQLRFREHLGRPVATEICRVRIERAKRELTQSKRTLEEISRAVGFGSAMQMYKVFSREFGVSPRDYRKQRRTEREA